MQAKFYIVLFSKIHKFIAIILIISFYTRNLSKNFQDDALSKNTMKKILINIAYKSKVNSGLDSPIQNRLEILNENQK